ncbi:MAG TPA: adenylate/guanylate cyclase domain-containing protein [Streptosporangiaceae bacterium]
MPEGTVTFLLTDIEGSTRMWEAHPAAMRHALERHNGCVRAAVEGHGGTVVTSRGEGDSFFAVFASAVAAVEAAAACQHRLLAEQWPPGISIRVRMALHTGEADLCDGEYHGHAAINRCARVRGAAHGGQVLVTKATRDLVLSHLDAGLGFEDLGEHRLRDISEPERIYQLTHPGLPREFGPISTLDRQRDNLPAQATSFIGRGDELAHAHEILSRNRILTLTGPGGAGKTRLALRIAGELAGRFADGAWLVELGALTDPELVPQQVAVVLRRPDLELGALRDKRLLIVLDNCEHLIGSCAELVTSMVSACPGIAVLSTSREPLQVPGEVTLVVQPLAPTDAARLFAERSAAVRPGLDLSRSSATVEAICRMLDGMPLAIELAAARTRAMTPAEILERLHDRFRLLTGGSRTAAGRHQTLRATVDWSYGLLDTHEKALFRRLSVFAGSWRMASAEAVCGDGAGADLDVPDLVLRLADKSLVGVEGDVRSRYRVLETLRQYGLERLDEAGEAAEFRRRHGEHFLALTMSDDWPTQTWWLDARVQAVAPELDNLRAALEWSQAQPADVQLSLVIGMAPLWMAQGRFAEGANALQGALDRSPEPTMLRLRALERLGWLAVEHGDLSSAAAAAEEMLGLSEHTGGGGRAIALSLAGYIALQMGDLAQASDSLAEGLIGYQAAGDLVGVAQVRHTQGSVARRRADLPAAQSLFAEVISIADKTGDHGLAVYALLSMIPILLDQGETAAARDRWQQAHHKTRTRELAVLNLALLGYAAAIAAADGQPARAVILAQVALRLQAETGWQDAQLLEWFWRTLSPAFEILGEDTAAEAQAKGDLMTVGEALDYAASGDDD